MELITKSAEETQEAAYRIADIVINNKEKTHVIALTGDLGSGKTTFMQGFAKALGITQRIISPTFILMRRYPFSKGVLYHLDMYRLNDNDLSEIENLGLVDIWNTKGNIVVIEWAEKIKGLLPSHTQWISFEYIDENTRKIKWD